MKTTLFKALTLVLVLLTTTIAAPAQGQFRKDQQPERRETQAYIEQNVLPVVRQQRQKLDAQLSTTDKAQLAIYRTQLKEARQRTLALRQSFRGNQNTTPNATEPASPQAALTEAQQQQLAQLHTEIRTILSSVSQMAEKYASNIMQLNQELQPQKEKWATDIQAITSKNATPELQEKPGRFRGRLYHRMGAGKFLRPTAFLLLDPAAATTVPAERNLGSTSVFPNPVVATSQLEYTVAKAGPVTVELLDGRGNALRTLAQEAKQEKGPHTLQVNLTDLPRGTYYYKITTRTGSETKRFVKE